MPQPENSTPAVDTGAVDSTPATNTSLLLDAVSTTTTAARKAGDIGRHLSRLAELISTHLDGAPTRAGSPASRS